MKVKTLKKVLGYFLTSDDPNIVKNGYRWRIWMCSRAINRYIRSK